MEEIEIERESFYEITCSSEDPFGDGDASEMK